MEILCLKKDAPPEEKKISSASITDGYFLMKLARTHDLRQPVTTPSIPPINSAKKNNSAPPRNNVHSRHTSIMISTISQLHQVVITLNHIHVPATSSRNSNNMFTLTLDLVHFLLAHWSPAAIFSRECRSLRPIRPAFYQRCGVIRRRAGNG